MAKRRIYTIVMDNNDVWGVPAELIAMNYASYYQSMGEDFQESFDTMIEWFDHNDFQFADWAKNNMNWSDVECSAFLIMANNKRTDFQDCWVNGEYGYEIL